MKLQRILFVCTGNTCRSPMAEAILKNKNIDAIEVKSAGIYAVNGSEASAHAKQVTASKGIFPMHRSSQLTNEVVNWADLILTMTSTHKMAIQDQYPQSIIKVCTLKEYIGNTPSNHDVVDPYGGSLALYEKTYHELEELIDQAIKRLTSLKNPD
ncbi:MAG: low molecular weight protein arginine phosphatase [Bacillus sp. (in: Bacteria)]|nr:low molecular weight protein arginine phosphatase [Bacillus sp. (in: firmicutes)]